MFIKSEIVSIPIEKKRGKIQNAKITENLMDKAIIQCCYDKHVVNLVSTKGLNKYNKRFVMTFIANGKCQIEVDNNIAQIRK